MELHIYRDESKRETHPGIWSHDVTYRAECGDFVSRIESPGNDNAAIGKIIRSKWMDMVFAKYKRVRVIVHF